VALPSHIPTFCSTIKSTEAELPRSENESLPEVYSIVSLKGPMVDRVLDSAAEQWQALQTGKHGSMYANDCMRVVLDPPTLHRSFDGQRSHESTSTSRDALRQVFSDG
jgi:hypothetical protein